MIVDVIHRRTYVKIRRTSELPYPGQVLVGEGTEVYLDDVVAESQIPSGLKSVDVARGLGVSPSEAKQYLVRRKGDLLDEGDIIAQFEGRITRLVRTPAKGLFLDFLHGKAVIASSHSKFQLKAGINGVVETVIPERGVTISLEGSLLQGVWGNGKIGEGKLIYLDPDIDDPLFVKATEGVEPGKVFVLEVCMDEMALINLANSGAAGLIISALAPRLITLVEEITVPVIILQGFGNFPPDEKTSALLKSREGDNTLVIAARTDETPGQRPEIIIPGGEGDPDEEGDYRSELAVGSSVLVLSGKSIGTSGEVAEMADSPKTYESGMSGVMAEIRTPEDQLVKVPCSNLVMIKYLS